MNVRVISAVIGVVALILTGPMTLLATVNDDECQALRVDGTVEKFACKDQLVQGDFWLNVTASSVGTVADSYPPLLALIATALGIPWAVTALRNKGNVENPPGA